MGEEVEVRGHHTLHAMQNFDHTLLGGIDCRFILES